MSPTAGLSRPACRRQRTFGFTLIELMIVVSIIGILASIAVPKFANLVRKSQEGATKGNLGVIRSALSIYYSDMEGFYPCSGTPLITDCLTALNVNGKFLSNTPAAYTPNYHSSSSDDRDINTCSFAGVWMNSAFELPNT